MLGVWRDVNKHDPRHAFNCLRRPVSFLLVHAYVPALVFAATLASATAWADDPPGVPPRTPATDAPNPRDTFPFRPYSFVVGALSSSLVLHADALCPEGSVCPFGGGGGIYVAAGRRYNRGREWIAGYDLSIRNARSLFSSATLQLIRIEHRWELVATPLHNLEAFVGVGGAVALFGELLGVRTMGALVGVSAGGSYNISAFVRIGVTLRIDALRFLMPFSVGDGVVRADRGVASLTASLMVSATFLGH
jgi:hypothetical protein